MGGQLITLPLRLWIRSARLALRVGQELTIRALATAVVLAGARDRGERSVAPASRERTKGSARGAREPGPAPARPVPMREAGPASAEAPELAGHVSEEDELVAESAEPGAAEGAGATVTVLEPWEGYRGMAAGEVIDRLAGTTPEELAAVELYEVAHRNRRTVREAVRRHLQSGGHRQRSS